MLFKIVRATSKTLASKITFKSNIFTRSWNDEQYFKFFYLKKKYLSKLKYLFLSSSWMHKEIHA